VFGFVKAKVFFLFGCGLCCQFNTVVFLRGRVVFFSFGVLRDARVGRHRHDCAFFFLVCSCNFEIRE
jgi:hypothetical protein